MAPTAWLGDEGRRELPATQTSQEGCTTLTCLTPPIPCCAVKIRRTTVLSRARTDLQRAEQAQDYRPPNLARDIEWARFILDMPYPFDYDKMAIDWCKEVDGVHVWPKLPVYLRTYHKQFQRNQRVKDAVRQAKTGAQKLKTLNQQTSNGLSSDTAQGRLPTAMPQASSIARRGEDLVCVGGTVVGGAPPPQNPQRRRNGERSADKEKRAPRRCRNCLRWGKTNQEAQTCKGRGPTGKCTLPDGGTGAVGGSGQD